MTGPGMESVNFIAMKDGTKEDYMFLQEKELVHAKKSLVPNLMEQIERLKNSFPGYKISRYEHSVQSATRAEKDGADIDWVVAALLHDIGDDLAPYCHDILASSVIRPYVREQVSWVIQHHGIFQAYYYAHHYGDDRNAREKYVDNPYYQDCVDFCEYWDQNAFDPDYQSYDLAHFEPMLTEVFSREPWAEKNMQAGKRFPLKLG